MTFTTDDLLAAAAQTLARRALHDEGLTLEATTTTVALDQDGLRVTMVSGEYNITVSVSPLAPRDLLDLVAAGLDANPAPQPASTAKAKPKAKPEPDPEPREVPDVDIDDNDF